MLRTEFQALQLTAWGIGVLLAALVIARLRDAVLHRPLAAGERTLGHMGPQMVGSVAALVATTYVLAFTVPIFSGQVHWLAGARFSAVLALACGIATEIVFVERLAYSRANKAAWVAGWIALSHLAVWGAAWIG